MTASITCGQVVRMKFTSTQKQKLARLTPFQRAVLLACTKIPKGQTRSYSDIARAAGRPKSARAAGNALAKNPLAPMIPCHRGIRSDAKLGGYSGKGGTEGKRRLLKMETNI